MSESKKRQREELAELKDRLERLRPKSRSGRTRYAYRIFHGRTLQLAKPNRPKWIRGRIHRHHKAMIGKQLA